jgi:DNA-binding regulatory protein, YebC/PmpR family
MSGHSKWNNIKNKKGKADAQRGKVFTKLGRELLMAVKQGGVDPVSNSKLRDVIAKCKASNMPNDTIDRGIKKAAGEDLNKNYEEIVYEGYGPSGVAVIVEATTDNRNRTAADVRHIFDKFGGNLGTTGCVSFMFDRKGILIIDRTTNKHSEDDLMMMALELGADDFESEEEYYQITTSPENFSNVREGLEKEGLIFEQAEIQMIPQTTVQLDEESAKKLEVLLEKLEENDDVGDVYHNWEE